MITKKKKKKLAGCKALYNRAPFLWNRFLLDVKVATSTAVFILSYNIHFKSVFLYVLVQGWASYDPQATSGLLALFILARQGMTKLPKSCHIYDFHWTCSVISSIWRGHSLAPFQSTLISEAGHCHVASLSLRAFPRGVSTRGGSIGSRVDYKIAQQHM